MKYFKLIALNSVVFLFLGVLVDLSLGFFLNAPVKYMCASVRYHHMYCSGSTRLYEMTKEDGAGVFISYWDMDGLRAKNAMLSLGHNYVVDEYDLVNVGDSFMAQRQVNYEDRISALIERNSSLKAMQVGVGSWAVLSYRNWIEDHDFKSGSEVNLFVMANDLYAYGYGMSNAEYHKTAVYEAGKYSWVSLVDEGLQMKVERFIVNQSFIYQRFYINKRKKDMSASVKRSEVLDSSLQDLIEDCAMLNDLKLITPYALSYALFAFDKTCWPKELVGNYNSVVNDIQAIGKHLKKYNSTLRVFFIPNGFFLSGEALGMKSHPAYNIKEDVLLAAKGLEKAFSQDLNYTFINLENELVKYKNENPTGKLYYSEDGHWTPLGSMVVSKAILSLTEKQGGSD